MSEKDPFRADPINAIRTDRTCGRALHSLALCLPLFPYAVKAMNDEQPWIMNSIATWFGAIGLATLAVGSPQKTHADGLTSADFISWDKPSQNSFLFSSVGMAAAIAS